MPSSPVYDVSFIPERKTLGDVQALPSARIMARERGVDLSVVNSAGYVTKNDVARHIDANTYPLNNKKCDFVTQSLDCIVGGFGHMGCMDRKFHEQCSFKARVNEILNERENKKKAA